MTIQPRDLSMTSLLLRTALLFVKMVFLEVLGVFVLALGWLAPEAAIEPTFFMLTQYQDLAIKQQRLGLDFKLKEEELSREREEIEIEMRKQ